MKRSRLALALFAAGSAFAQCEASGPVSRLLGGEAFGRKAVETQADEAARAAAFRSALAQYPDNYFLLRRQLQVSYFFDPEERIRAARELHKQHPDNPLFELLQAFALIGKDTPQAIRRMEALEAAHPQLERVPIELASVYDAGRFKDKSRVQKELDEYLRLCPESIDASFLAEVSDNGTPEQAVRAAVALRKRLEAETGDPLPDKWEALWRLEFKAHPLSEHAEVRRKVAGDLARFEKSPRRDEVAWMVFLRDGYQSLGDQAAVLRMSDEIVAEHAESPEAKRTVEERWRKEHPAEDRLHLAAAREWHQRWPADADILFQIFDDLAHLPDTTSGQIAAAVDEFQAAYRKQGDFFTVPPIEFAIAEAYVKHKIRLDQVPAVVDTGYRDAARRNARNRGDDRLPDANVQMLRDSLDSMHMQAAGILLDCYRLTGQPGKAREVMAGVASVDTSKPAAKAAMAALRAKAAEAEGRKLDALLLYRAAIDGDSQREDLAEGLARLWQDLGGTSEGYALLRQRPKVSEATESRWQRPENPLPAFTLPDLSGKTWKLASLEGKTLLVNIWATWCGPCKAEHPEFQKLYDQLKDRADVTVLSFNVDEDLGKVAPYIAENHYTFPVIPAKDLVDTVVPSLAIPRNWLVDARGKLEWEQVGYGAEAGWQEQMLGKLDEVIRGGHQ